MLNGEITMSWKNELKKEMQDMYNINSALDDFAGNMLRLKDENIAKLKQLGYAGAANLDAKLDAIIKEITAQ